MNATEWAAWANWQFVFQLCFVFWNVAFIIAFLTWFIRKAIFWWVRSR